MTTAARFPNAKADADAAQRLLERSVPSDILSDWRVLQDLLVGSRSDPSVLLTLVPEIRSEALRQALGRLSSRFRAAQVWLRLLVVALVTQVGIGIITLIVTLILAKCGIIPPPLPLSLFSVGWNWAGWRLRSVSWEAMAWAWCAPTLQMMQGGRLARRAPCPVRSVCGRSGLNPGWRAALRGPVGTT